MTVNIDDIQKLIDYSVRFAKTSLAEFKEFYPFAAAINNNGEIIPIALHEGDEFPECKDLSAKLELLLENQLKNSIKRAFAITSNVVVKRSDDEHSHEAILIKIRQSGTKECKVYFFEYNLFNEKEVEITNSWRDD